jgi:branched-chain amino acid aminotransferase
LIVDLNGDLLEDGEARISPFDQGFLYGDGIFDTLRAYRGFLYRLEDHIERLWREADLLQIPFDPSTHGWRTRLTSLLEANDLVQVDCRVRIQISRGGQADTDHVRAQPEELRPNVFVTARPVLESLGRQQLEGVRIMSLQSSFARGNFPQIKSLNYLPSIMALRFAGAKGFSEACLLNSQQKVLEGATSNIFIVRGGTLLTPPARLGLLPGITRDVVVRLGRAQDLHVEERAFDLREMLIADEAFLTGSVKEIVPIVGVDRTRIGEGRPGPWTKRLQEAYARDVAQHRTTANG